MSPEKTEPNREPASRGKVAFSTPWFQIYEENWKDPLGHEKIYYRMESADGVIIIPVAEDGELILIRQYRPALGEYSLEFPAGGVERKEDSLYSAKRELLEETGCQSEDWHEIGYGHVAMDRLSNKLYGYVALNCKRVQDVALHEGIELVKISYDELKRLALTNEYRQVGGMGFLLKAQWILEKFYK